MKNDQSNKKDININKDSIFSINIFAQSKDALLHQYVSKYLNIDQKSLHSVEAKTPPQTAVIFTPNPEQLVRAHHDPQFFAALQQATINIPDGIGVVLASRLLALVGKSTSIHERISGVDLVQALVMKFPDQTYAWIGGKGQASTFSEQVVTVGAQSHPWFPGYEDVANPSEDEELAVRAFIKKHKPDVLFVAFGAPHQEYWTLRHRQFLTDQGVKVVLVVGGSIDIFTHRLQRPPQWIRAVGAEWLYRLIQEPWRWRRQLSLLTFIRLVLREFFF